MVVVENGLASFSVGTTIPVIEVSGKATALQAHAQISRRDNGITIEHIEALLPVRAIKTGMEMRDSHMAKYIFTTAKGEVPDVRFESERIDCPGVAPGHETVCTISGNLSIRGVLHAFSLSAKVRQDAGGASFRVIGDGIVKLSDYGIERPTQLGVSTTDDVKVHLDFNGRQGAMPTMTASSGGGK
jgi:polyisoprenoid-binding protein YceI